MSSIQVLCSGKSESIPADDGENLLCALRRAGYSLPAACGGHGRCGKCRVRVNGVPRLACRVFPKDGDTVEFFPASGGRILVETPQITVIPHGESGFAAAIDCGTTTVAVRLYHLADGQEAGTLTQWNRQSSYGGDVISRIEATLENPENRKALSAQIRQQTEEMLAELLQKNGADRSSLQRTVLCGNTVMQHLFAGLSVAGLGRAPFCPETLFRGDFPDLLLGAPLLYAPCVAGYVGGDVVCGLLATDLANREGVSLFLDLGTNGEMVLGGKKGLLAAAVATGPALEGAGITCGMAAVDGAVSHVQYQSGFLTDQIGDGKAHGLCGSGVLDLAAVLAETGCLTESGRLLSPEEAPQTMRRYLETDENGNGRLRLTQNIFFTQRDVRQLQLAKGAVAAGIRILLAQEKIPADGLSAVLLAGGLGNTLRPESALAIGMLPPLGRKKLHTVGNTALAGAALLALCPEKRKEALEIAQNCKYLALSGRADFSAAFAESMPLRRL